MDKFDSDTAAAVMSWLNSKAIRPCSGCGGSKMNVSRFVAVPTYHPKQHRLLAEHVPMAQVRCETCGHLSHFDLEVMGLVQTVPPNVLS